MRQDLSSFCMGSTRIRYKSAKNAFLTLRERMKSPEVTKDSYSWIL